MVERYLFLGATERRRTGHEGSIRCDTGPTKGNLLYLLTLDYCTNIGRARAASVLIFCLFISFLYRGPPPV